ncbi:MAG TPA: outer membrane protein assembly factor BamD [Gammaproteobacteria bacterium]|nr:outer membrane protein assembly factor BamD [Gammaproteobacteria bacterium]
MRLPIRFTMVLLVLLLGACAGVEKKQEWSAQRYYQEAKSALDARDYESAIRYYEELKAAYPYGEYAEQADLDIIYAYYKGEEPESAIAAADNFIKQHPRHPKVDYAYYLRGLASFSQGESFLNELFDQDPTQRDPSHLRRSFNYFSELVRKFPDSRYRADALQRMKHLYNSLARHEIHVARFYLEREAHLAAANRAKYVVEHYQNSPSVAEALAIMERAYRSMGREGLADDARRVLKLNFPDHPAAQQMQ